MNGPGRPSVITPATDHQLLLTDDGNGALSALGPSPGNEGSACKPSNYADILIPSSNDHSGRQISRYPGGWIIWPTYRALFG